MFQRVLAASVLLAVAGCTSATSLLQQVPKSGTPTNTTIGASTATVHPATIQLGTLGLVSLHVDSVQVQVDPVQRFDGYGQVGVYAIVSTNSVTPPGVLAIPVAPASDGWPDHFIVPNSFDKATKVIYADPGVIASDWQVKLGDTVSASFSVTPDGWLQADFPASSSGQLSVIYDAQAHPNHALLEPQAGTDPNQGFFVYTRGTAWDSFPTLTKRGTASVALQVKEVDGTPVSGLTTDYFAASIAARAPQNGGTASASIQSITETASGSYRLQLRFQDTYPNNIAYDIKIQPVNKPGLASATFYRR